MFGDNNNRQIAEPGFNQSREDDGQNVADSKCPNIRARVRPPSHAEMRARTWRIANIPEKGSTREDQVHWTTAQPSIKRKPSRSGQRTSTEQHAAGKTKKCIGCITFGLKIGGSRS